jgi:hypothetical protein
MGKLYLIIFWLASSTLFIICIWSSFFCKLIFIPNAQFQMESVVKRFNKLYFEIFIFNLWLIYFINTNFFMSNVFSEECFSIFSKSLCVISFRIGFIRLSLRLENAGFIIFLMFFHLVSVADIKLTLSALSGISRGFIL